MFRKTSRRPPIIADRYVISTVMEPIRLELQLTDSGIAFLTGVVLSLFYVTFGIPLSLLADRVNRRNLIAISLVVWSAMTVLCGRAANYLQLLLPRIGVGIGEAGGTPSATSLLADYFPPIRRLLDWAKRKLEEEGGSYLRKYKKSPKQTDSGPQAPQ